MDRFSFLNAVHPSYIAELYDKYLQMPDMVEPSWRAFFQGFDFALEHGSLSTLGIEVQDQINPQVFKEFKVIKLIDGYRTRGHLFTKTNPVRERRQYHPSLTLENFGLSKEDLDREFEAGSILGIGKTALGNICHRIKFIVINGVEYMYIRNPEEIQWIQNLLNANDNHPTFSPEEKKHILNNSPLSHLRVFCIRNMWGKNVFQSRG